MYITLMYFELSSSLIVTVRCISRIGRILKFRRYFIRPLSVNSQSGGQNNKIVLHLKGLFLSGDRTTIVLSSRLGITEMGLCSVFIFLCI